jgi:hypothetical protein
MHLPADAEPGDASALEDAELVKDGFVWGAFFFTFLWFFWNRLWIAGLIVLAAIVGLASLLQALRVHTAPAFVAEILLAILIGLEANSLRRWTLRRRKPAVDVVTASDRKEAEVKAFARWLASADRRPAFSPARPAAAAPYRRAEPVIGLFPDAERPR